MSSKPKNGFGSRLLMLRKQMKLSQPKLAIAVKDNQRAISRYETEGSFPSTETLKEMSKLFNVSVHYLLYGCEDDLVNKNIDKRLPAILSHLVDKNLLTDSIYVILSEELNISVKEIKSLLKS